MPDCQGNTEESNQIEDQEKLSTAVTHCFYPSLGNLITSFHKENSQLNKIKAGSANRDADDG